MSPPPPPALCIGRSEHHTDYLSFGVGPQVVPETARTITRPAPFANDIGVPRRHAAQLGARADRRRANRRWPRSADGVHALPEKDLKSIAERLDRADRRLLERLAPAARPRRDFAAADAFVWHAGRARAAAGRQGQPRRPVAAQGHRPHARHPAREHRALRRAACRPTTRSSGARAAWARARWSRRCTPPSTARRRRGAAEADRDPPRGHRDPAGADGAAPRPRTHRFILFCDDLSFDADDTSYKSLKAALEGGIEGRPDNVVFYATSNRRHLLPRDMMENERSTAINPYEAVRGEGLAVGPLRPLARLPQLQPGRIPGDGARLRRALRLKIARGGRGGRGAGMGDDARQPLGPRRLAVRAGSGGAAWGRP